LCDDDHREPADVVFACDGLGSLVRRSVGLDRPTRSPVRFGLRAHFASRPWSDDVEVYWSPRGEAYVTPVARDLVGVAVLGDRGSSFDERLADFPALRARLVGAEQVGPVLGAGPLRRAAARPVRGGVLLVGDAAGYVDALTGEGLSVGFASAQVAVAAVVDGVADRYAHDWAVVTRRFRWSTTLLLRGTQQRLVRRSLVPAAVALPRVFSRAVAQIG
jgi:flavin-dependent dehydrogenase